MKGDFSKRYEVSDDNFAGVLYQQGRVFLDADGNAQTWITSTWQDTAGRDVIGPNVAAVPADQPASFKVQAAELVDDTVTLTIGPGHVWADGLLLRLDETPPVTRVATYLQPPIQDPPFDESTIAAGVRDAVVLEVWRETINGFQIPDQLIEPALGGPDTTERVHTASAYRLFRLGSGQCCDNIADDLADDFANKGRLTVTLEPPEEIPGDCPVAEGGGYTGFEHHTYRIEIAETNGGPTMFKWSQFNGGLVGRGLFDAVAERVTITANLQAITTSGLDSFHLETREYDAALGRWRVTYGAEVTLGPNGDLVLPAAPTFGAVPAPGTPVFFRLWNDIRGIAEFPPGANPVPLGDGIRLEFEPDAAGKYVAEDYWIFEARAGEIANPETLVDNAPSDGIHYHRVPLAVLNWDGSPDLSAAEGTIDDCRDPFPPLTRLANCCTYRVGDGIHSHGDFDSIQEAIDKLPGAGGQICLLPGLHETNAVIRDRANIRITGCGKHSRMIPRLDNREAPIFHVIDSECIMLDSMDMISLSGTAILAESSDDDALRQTKFFPKNIGEPLMQSVRILTVAAIFCLLLAGCAKKPAEDLSASLSTTPPSDEVPSDDGVRIELPDESVSKSQSTFNGSRAGQEFDGKGLKMTLCWCPSGSFKMGSPPDERGRHDDEDQVQVTLTKGFWLGKHEVTQGQWQAIMGDKPWSGDIHSSRVRKPFLYLAYGCRLLVQRI